MISFPVRRGSGRFILKLDPPEFPHLCRNEWLMLQAARTSGLPTVTAALVIGRDAKEAEVARTMLRWVAFAYVTGDGDLHAKNVAVAERPDGTVQAAPAFELPSSYPYGDTTMAMTVAGKSREDIGRGDLMALASQWRLPARAAAKVLDEVVDHVDVWLPSLDDSGFPERVVHKWRRAIDDRRTRLAP